MTGSGNDLASRMRQSITSISTELLLVVPPGTNFSEISVNWSIWKFLDLDVLNYPLTSNIGLYIEY